MFSVIVEGTRGNSTSGAIKVTKHKQAPAGKSTIFVIFLHPSSQVRAGMH